ncbi:hypothetical protein [Acidiphilium sp. MT5]
MSMRTIESNHIETNHNIIPFARQTRALDLDALVDVEPDIMLADSLAEQFGLEPLPFDLIDRSERETRIKIAESDQSDLPAFHAQLQAMSERAFATAIAACHQARRADQQAARLRAAATAAAAKRAPNQHAPNQHALDAIATQAEARAAIATLDALAEAHHARGVDAAVSLKLLGVDHSPMFGLVEIF